MTSSVNTPIKVREPEPDAGEPWRDDLLERRGVAVRLTNIVADQEPPLTVSLHGGWGIGKTFLLKRWQKELESDGYRAIYFNAWEDDYSRDPLLAILGQLSVHFRDSSFTALAQSAAKAAIPLVTNNALGILAHFTGLQLDLDRDDRKTPFDDYADQGRTKELLKENLAELAKGVRENTGHPMVFIIDELDRCRPTFAIELLERVKHIFDVPNLVFVFGLNRDELKEALRSIYGKIDADVYLRRFFDFEFNLSEVDARGYATHLIEAFDLRTAFGRLDTGDSRGDAMADFANYLRILPRIWSGMGLTLRDIRYGIQLLALLARNATPGMFTHPFLLVILVGLKFRDPEKYRSLVEGTFDAGEIVDYIQALLRDDLADNSVSANLDRIEGFLYCASEPLGDRSRSQQAYRELVAAADRDTTPIQSSILSGRAKVSQTAKLDRIAKAIEDGWRLEIDIQTFGHLASLIDTNQAALRR